MIPRMSLTKVNVFVSSWLSHTFEKHIAQVKSDHFPNFGGQKTKIFETNSKMCFRR